LLYERLILPPFPRAAELRMNAVHEQMNVRVSAVAVGDDDCLMFG